MIEDNTTWYIGTVENGISYKLAKYTDINMSSTTSITADVKVGLLRFGELMSGQFNQNNNNSNYWLLTINSPTHIYYSNSNGTAASNGYPLFYGIKPAFNLKSNVIITSGDGTKNNPFTLELP